MIDPCQEVSMDRIFKESNRWYSKRGTKRGLVLALVILGFWCFWAIGYLQGAKHFEQRVLIRISSVINEKSLMQVNFTLSAHQFNHYDLERGSVWT
jgi:hypothetical protein